MVPAWGTARRAATGGSPTLRLGFLPRREMRPSRCLARERSLRVVWAAPATRGSFAGACASPRALALQVRRPTPGIVWQEFEALPSLVCLRYRTYCRASGDRRSAARRPSAAGRHRSSERPR